MNCLRAHAARGFRKWYFAEHEFLIIKGNYLGYGVLGMG